MKGIIVKGIGGFYYVKVTDDAENCRGNVYQCRGRGIFKKDGTVLTVGDVVDMELLPDGDGVINRIYPRKNIFIRPPIANVDCMVVVMAASSPEPNLPVIDRFLVMAEKSGTEIYLCVNKTDLAAEERLEKIRSIYEGIYPLFFVSATQGLGTDELKRALAGKHCALAGPSGVGKSTLLNVLENYDVETGMISRKTNRGRHTTRHVEIFDMEYGGMIFDTPGFTSFDVLTADEDELSCLYPEMREFLGECRFDNCRHLKEPDCAVRTAVDEGKIHLSRYRSYAGQITEIIEKQKNKY